MLPWSMAALDKEPLLILASTGREADALLPDVDPLLSLESGPVDPSSGEARLGEILAAAAPI